MRAYTSFTVAACLLVSACGDHVKANTKALQTTDCGVTWTQIKTGERIPSTATNVCGYNTVLPDYPMQGDTEFLTQFTGNILVKVKITYDYEIVNGVRYLSYAKFLGKMTATGAEAS